MNISRADVTERKWPTQGDSRRKTVPSCVAVNTPEPLDLGRYHEPLLGHIRSIVRNAAEAEDVLQEVFVPHLMLLDQPRTRTRASYKLAHLH
jgi:hypothetical protein